MGRRPRPRGPVRDAVLIVDKAAGPTSHDVVAGVRRVVGHSRVGHTGTLDPAATGVLVLGLGRATKLVRFLQAGTKTYAARIRLGVETDTQDADGVVVATVDASHLDERTVCEALTRFQGEFEQIPPMVSAVKVDGERLHVKARRGEVVERTARPVRVDSLVLDAFTPGAVAEVSVLLTCSAGTYVRTLAHDVGQRLGVGASLTALRRLATGGFGLEDALTLDEIEALGADKALRDRLVPAADALRLLPTEVVDTAVRDDLVHGRPTGPHGHDGPYAIRDDAGHLVGVYADRDGRARPEVVMLRPEDVTSG